MDAPAPNNLDDYSPSSTVITFDRPIPLLRGPLPAGISDDPSSGPYVLAFRHSQAWASSYRACERKIVQQCEEGARIGCAISASNKCKPPWWKLLLDSNSKPSDLKERELCEEREMRDCFAEAKKKCVEFARDKCLIPFRDARIKVGEIGLNSNDAAKLIHLASMPERSLLVMSQMDCRCLFGCEFGVTNHRASELLGYDDCVQCILGWSRSYQTCHLIELGGSSIQRRLDTILLPVGLLEIVEAECEFLDAEYDEYGTSNANAAICQGSIVMLNRN